jgi:hypothetical protein
VQGAPSGGEIGDEEGSLVYIAEGGGVDSRRELAPSARGEWRCQRCPT